MADKERLLIDKKYFEEISAYLIKSLRKSRAEIYRLINRTHWRYSDKNLETILNIIENSYSEAVTFSTIPTLHKMAAEHYSSAVKQTLKSLKQPSFSWDIRDENSIRLLNRHDAFFFSKYFTMNQKDTLRKHILEVFESGVPSDELKNRIRSELNKTAKASRAYTKSFIDTAGTRARAFAKIQTLDRVDIKRYRISGFRDERTCPVCSKLIGKTFEVKDQLEIIKNTFDIDYSKPYEEVILKLQEFSPFVGYSRTKQKYYTGTKKLGSYREYEKDDFLKIPGIELVPAHNGCRCSINGA